MESSLISNTALVRTTNWKGHRVTSKVPLASCRLPLLSRPGTRPMHEKRNERERYEWEQWSMANPWRTRGDRNSRWKDTVVGAYRRHRWAQKARKRPVAIRLAGWDRRWHRTKLESTASVAVRIERGKRREGERKKGERERESVCAGEHSRATVLERAGDEGDEWGESVNTRMNRGPWFAVRKVIVRRSEGKDCSAIFIVIEWSFLYFRFRNFLLELTLKLNDLNIFKPVSWRLRMLGSRKEIVARKCIVAINVLLGILKELKNWLRFESFFFFEFETSLHEERNCNLGNHYCYWMFFFYFQYVINNFKLNY